MTRLIIITFFLIAGKAFGQPTLSSFTATQQAQIKAYSRWQAKQSSDSVKATLTPITKGTIDSLVNFAKLYKLQQTRQDSASTALKIITANVTAIQGSYATSTEISTLKSSILETQATLKIINDLISNIKKWIEMGALINF